MPTYDYECGACGHAFELFQAITAKPVRKCPSCGRPRAKRLIGTGAGVLFRGSGFYQTDYRSDGYKQKAKAEKESAGGTTTKSGEGGATKAACESSTKSKGESSGSGSGK
jgi:putative FmdB family regulatory protein